MHIRRQAITTIQSNSVRLKSRDEQDLTSPMVSPELLFCYLKFRFARLKMRVSHLRALNGRRHSLQSV